MKLALFPFFSMQDKRTGKFLFHKEGACKQMAFIADSVRVDLAWDTRVFLPDPRQCVDYHAISLDFSYSDVTCGYVPQDNRVQRIHWDANVLREAIGDADVAVCQHEFFAVPLRALKPKLKIVQMCVVDPVPLQFFRAAWEAADLVRFKSVAEGIAWPLAYDERDFPQQPIGGERNIDVLFLPRCSADNCTHHLEFIEALGDRAVFTDPTFYIRTQPIGVGLKYIAGNYKAALRDSRVVVSLRRDAYGGVAVREAVRCGCVPVLLRTPAHERLAGEGWPFFVDRPDPQLIRCTVERALAEDADCSDMQRRVAHESYQASWSAVREDLVKLCS